MHIKRAQRLSKSQRAIGNYHAKIFSLEYFTCPITKEIMREAVVCVMNGLSYERKAILYYLMDHKKTPDGIPLQNDADQPEDLLIPNHYLDAAIQELVPRPKSPGVKGGH